ncbi:unnamed protein product [Meganyctiphanes norvegica]|uniref:Uncharacterized protein n=1 Tax=Meganyctiphanes norvegica TaxID=48144 RepID=A0AAV2RHA6_MEGNR
MSPTTAGLGKYDFSINCRNCDQDFPELRPCEITGLLPSWLTGSLIYNGPGKNVVGQTRYKHTFDSSAILQKFEINNGEVLYNNRFLASKVFESNQATGKITKAEFGTPVANTKGTFARIFDAMDPEKMFSDNALVNVVEMGGKYYALAETPFMFQICPSTLKVLDRVNVNKEIGLMTQCPHPIKDNDGYYYTIGQGVSVSGPKYNIIRFPENGDISNGKVMTSVTPRMRLTPSYMHSMGITENYIILVEQPLRVSMKQIVSDIMNNSPFIDGMKWTNESVLIHLISRKTWKPIKTRYVSDPFFFMHIVNCYEEDGHIILDIPMYKDSTILHNMFIDKIQAQSGINEPEFVESFQPHLRRLVIPVNTEGKGNLVKLNDTQCTAAWKNHEVFLRYEEKCSYPMDNPEINPTYQSKKYRYTWAMGPNPDGSSSGFVVKVDLKENKHFTWSEPGLYTSSPVFIPKPGSQEEDDGILGVLLLSPTDNQYVSLLFLDASDLRELARATIIMPGTIPMPLHGSYIQA